MGERVSSRALALCAVALAPGCEALDSSANCAPVVGGQPEAGYPAAGYMLVGDDVASLDGPFCSAAIVAPRVAVTVAHCAWDRTDGAFGVAVLAGDSHVVHPAERVVVHQSYDRFGSPRYRHDLAALILEEEVPVEPATIAQAEAGDLARTVGYGRVTPGGYDVTLGYTGERKSAAQQVSDTDTWNLWTTGVDGGLCWGDSGGPLFLDGTSEVLGVLSDFDGVFNCYEGNSMIFTSLWGERDFVTQVIACAESGDPDCTPRCEFLCEIHGYESGECRSGWYCDGECIVHNGCEPSPVCRFRCDEYGYDPGECHRGWYCDGECLESVDVC